MCHEPVKFGISWESFSNCTLQTGLKVYQFLFCWEIYFVEPAIEKCNNKFLSNSKKLMLTVLPWRGSFHFREWIWTLYPLPNYNWKISFQIQYFWLKCDHIMCFLQTDLSVVNKIIWKWGKIREFYIWKALHKITTNKIKCQVVWNDQVCLVLWGHNSQKKYMTASSDWCQTDPNLWSLVIWK